MTMCANCNKDRGECDIDCSTCAEMGDLCDVCYFGGDE